MNYEKLINEQEAIDFVQQMLEIPFIESARKIKSMSKDPLSKQLFIKTALWMEWCEKYEKLVLGNDNGKSLRELLENDASDEEIQIYINSL